MPKSKKVRSDARKRAHTVAGDVAGRVGPTVESARAKAAPALADARAKAAPVLADARAKAAPVIADARDKAAPVIADARAKAAPMIAEAREKAAPAMHEVHDRFTADVLPVLTAAAAAAGEATEEVRGETKKRGKAALAALRGEVEAPPAKKKHRFRKFLLVLGLGGIAAAVAKKMSDRQATSSWESASTPAPAPTPVPTPAPAAEAGAHRGEADTAEDQGGSSPDVAAADAAAEPHAATTPDAPAETVDVSDKQ